MANRTLLVLCCFVSLTIAVPAAATDTAQPTAPVPIDPESLTWFGPPNYPLLRAVWVVGAEKETGIYVLRVKLGKGGKIPPHAHPDQRYSTVLSGTLYVGFGETMDESSMVAVPAGSIYVAPADVPHYLWAKDDDVLYQEGGFGPTATVPVAQ